MFILRSYLWLYMLYVRHSGKNNRLKSRCSICITADISIPKLCQKIKKNLIICCSVYLIDNQNNRLLILPAPSVKQSEQII